MNIIGRFVFVKKPSQLEMILQVSLRKLQEVGANSISPTKHNINHNLRWNCKLAYPIKHNHHFNATTKSPKYGIFLIEGCSLKGILQQVVSIQ